LQSLSRRRTKFKEEREQEMAGKGRAGKRPRHARGRLWDEGKEKSGK